MAIDLGTKTAALSERTKFITISVPLGGDAETRVDRETVTVGPDGVLLATTGAPSAVRLYSKIKDSKYSVSGLTLTGEQLYGIIAGVADLWRQEDIAAAKA